MSTPDVSELFQSAKDDGVLSQASMAALSIPDMGAKIQAGLGVCVDDVPSSEVLLVTIMPDDSGSIRFEGNAQAVRDGHNLVLKALRESKQAGSVLVHTRYLNGEVLFPYVPLDQAMEMTSSNYDPRMGTPLYDQSVVLLGTVLAKAQEFADAGVVARTVTLIITDGDDVSSVNATSDSVRTVANDLLRAETHILAGMGLKNSMVDFNTVFAGMGIPDEWILTPENTEGDIRKAFQVFSQSAVRASQGAASFSQAAIGGFGSG